MKRSRRFMTPGLNLLHREQSGQMIVMVAISLTVMLFIAALVIDIGFQTQSRRNAQNAADAMVLAGAQQLCGTATCEEGAKDIAVEWGSKNGISPSQITYNEVNGTSCKEPAPAVDYLTVRVRVEKSTFLAHLFGVGSTAVNVCATARATYGEGNYAIFANDTCPSSDTLLVGGSTSSVEGRVHSNCTIEVSGSDDSFNGPVTYVSTFKNGGGGNTYSETPASTTVQPWPVKYTYADIVPSQCTYTVNGDMDLSKSQYYEPDGITLKPGVYCQTDASKKISSPKQGAKGNVTFVSAGEIALSGSDFNFTAYWNDIVAYSNSSSSSAMDISGSNGSWTGLFVAPNGKIKFQGSSNTSVSGGFIGDTVSTSGSNWNLAAMDDSEGSPHIKLVE